MPDSSGNGTAFECMVTWGKMNRAAIHGDDANGNWDIEFPNVGYAARFAEDVTRSDDFNTAVCESVVLRDTVTTLDQPCTLTVRLNPEFKWLLF